MRMALALDSSRLHLLITVACAEVIRLTGHSNAAARSSAVPKPTPGRLWKMINSLGVYILIQVICPKANCTTECPCR